MGLSNKEKLDKELYETLDAICRNGKYFDVNNMKKEDAVQMNQLLNKASALLEEKYTQSNDKLFMEAEEGVSFFLYEHTNRSSKERQQLWNQLLNELPRVITRIQGLE